MDQIPHIGIEYLDDAIGNLVGRWALGLEDPEYKFVLTKGPGNLGFVHFGDPSENHGDILQGFYRKVRANSGSHREFEKKGGGFVVATDLKPQLDTVLEAHLEDRQKPESLDHIPYPLNLAFFSGSNDLGDADMVLLEKTLEAHLDNAKYTYRI